MHHVVILDDSLSMRDREGETTVFHQALQTLENMLAEGSRQPGSSRITLLSTTDPDARLFLIALLMRPSCRKSCRDFAT
jgi:hypothetical protein